MDAKTCVSLVHRYKHSILTWTMKHTRMRIKARVRGHQGTTSRLRKTMMMLIRLRRVYKDEGQGKGEGPSRCNEVGEENNEDDD